MGMLESLFAQDSPLAEKACALMCRFRGMAGALAVALSPDLPIAVSHRAVEHTWPAYRGAMSIFFADWQEALRQLEAANVPVELVSGSRDRSQVPGLAVHLARRYRNLRSVCVAGATHILPITQGELCANLVLTRKHLL
jgi:pimeloyl-ACP methyl ester carboxylesterase